MEPARVEVVGWMLAKTKHKVVLTHLMSEFGGVGSIFVFPRGAIRKITVLK